MKEGFTLAEVLIIIGIIGVIAILTIPNLLRQISTRVDSTRQANIAQKITKAMEIMSAEGEFGAFASTDEFVDVLQKYLKVVKRCSADEITQCWPTRYIKDSTGAKYDVSKAKDGRSLHIVSNTTDNVGLVLADGSSIILTYNQDFGGYTPETLFTGIKKELPIGFGKTKEFAYSSSVTAPIDFVMDVNGSAPPNAEATDEEIYDIRSFKVASFTNIAGNCTKLPDGKCFVALQGGEFEPVNCSSPYAPEYKYCQYNAFKLAQDYFAGAFKACEVLKMEYADDTTSKNLYNSGLIPKVRYFNNNTYASNQHPLAYNTANTGVICISED